MGLEEHRFQLSLGVVGRSAAQLAAVLASVDDGTRVVPTGATRATVVFPLLGYADLLRVQQVARAVRVAGARVDGETRMVLRIDAIRFDAHAHRSLQSIVAKQAALAAHALGHPAEALAFRRVKTAPFSKDAIEITLPSTLHGGEVAAVVVLALATVERALTTRGASSKPRPFDPASAKYQFRCILLRLGLVGDAYRDVREQLLKRLPGSAAWRRGRPARAPRTMRPAALEFG